MKIRQLGYLLPATIMLGLGIATLSVTVLQVISTANVTLTSKMFNSIAQDAAVSGIKFANGCRTSGTTTWSPLTPGNNCSGRPSTNCSTLKGSDNPGFLQQSSPTGEWRSFYCVDAPDPSGIITSHGIVEQLRGSTVVERYNATSNTSAISGYETRDLSQGQAITAIKNDRSDCAIANGKLYCWGSNANGQLGVGDHTDRSTPTLVQDGIKDKTVTKVSVSDTSVCAIADGLPYCWGGNGVDQLGNDLDGSFLKNDVTRPTNNIPRTSTGPLNSKYVTDIGTASMNNPAGPIWPFSSAAQHSCALTEEGSVACWGYGGFRQMTGGGCIFLIITLRCAYPSEAYPTLVKGYSDNTGDFAGKKGVRIGASSHDSCVVAEGILYCWGVQAPLLPEGFGQNGIDIGDLISNLSGFARLSCTLPLGMFSDPMITLWLFNPCVSTYANSYDATNSNSSQAYGTFLDPATFDVSSNEGCWMAENDFYCFGVTPAYATFWMEAFRAPWRVISNTDVTDADNGDSNDFITGGFVGLYCIVEKGIGKCAGQPGNPNTGAGSASPWYKTFRALSTTTAPELADYTAMKIAAGYNHGCAVANGKLFCWGDPYNGVLANGSTTTRYGTPRLTGRGGSTPIGTDGANQYAAHDSVSTGGGHSCGIANGKLFCWGKNTDGQLGVGSSSTLYQPRIVSMPTSVTFTKVSAGKDHTCAIADGSLYCWGRNANGQLGIPGGSVNTPQLVNGNGALTTSMRVTDVSASDTGTCAVANAKVYCWGSNSKGQLGDASNSPRTTPVLVTGGSNLLNGKAATAVSMGREHTCAIANSDLYCWGSNSNKQLGITGGDVNSPRLVNQGTANSPRGPNNVLPSVSAVSAGNDFTCAIFNANVSCWGKNSRGQAGQAPAADVATPTAVQGVAGTYYATTISAGNDHACALLHGNDSKKNGNMYCWGSRDDGKLGYGNATPDRSSVTIPIIGTSAASDMRESGEIRTATAISAGSANSCAIANAVILCWGNGSTGQIGNGLTNPANWEPLKTEKYQVAAVNSNGPVF